MAIKSVWIEEDCIADIPELCELKKLFKKALDKNKWVIHYGI